MKKIILLILACTFFLYGFSQNQAGERIKSLAKDMCDCIMPALDTLHPALKALMMDMIELSEDSASKKFAVWYATASEKDKGIIQQHITLMDAGGGMPVIKDCETKLAIKYPESVDQLQSTESEFYKKLATYMMLDKKCKLLGAILQLGSKKEGD